MVSSKYLRNQWGVGSLKHWPFYVGLATLLFAAFARNILAWPIPVLLLLLIVVVTSLFSDRSEIITLAICCIPLSDVFQYKYAILACMVVYILRFHKGLRCSVALIPLLAMMVWEILHAFSADFSIAEYLRDFAELIFLVFLISAAVKNMRYGTLCRAYAISCLAVMVIVLLNLLKASDYNFIAIFEGTYRFGAGNLTVENYGANYNSNALGGMVNLGLCGLLQLNLCKQQKRLDYVWMILLVFFGILTMSRSFFICLALLLVMYVLAGKKNVTKIVGRLLFVLFAILLIGWVMQRYVPEILERILERFGDDDISGGRIELFKFYNTHLFAAPQYLLFGLGLQGMPQIIDALYGAAASSVPHNAIQELLVVWGIPGLCMFLAFLFGLVRFSWRKEQDKRKLIHFMPLILLLIAIQSGQLITSGQALLELGFAFVSMRTVFGVNSNELD